MTSDRKAILEIKGLRTQFFLQEGIVTEQAAARARL